MSKLKGIAPSEVKKIQALEATRELVNFFNVSDDRGQLQRYIDRGYDMPSAEWCRVFLLCGGSFDSCGHWGFTPDYACEIESAGVSAEFAGEMLAFAGRADHHLQFPGVVRIWETGFKPKNKYELFAIARGLERLDIAIRSGIENTKSILGYGWMSEKKFTQHIMEGATKIAKDLYGFNSVEYWKYAYQGVKNPVFKKFLQSKDL